MARKRQTESFNNHAPLEVDDIYYDQSAGDGALAWSHKKKNMPGPVYSHKKNRFNEENFVYRPVTDFNENEDIVTAEPEKRIDPAKPKFASKHLNYTKKENPMPARRSSFNPHEKNLTGYDFSGKDLRETDFSGTSLRGVDFSGAVLSGADFSNCDLTGAIFDGAILNNANFYKAKLHNASLHNADIENAILLEADLDNLTIEELQELIEFLAANFPHKVNLAKINLFMLDLKKIDLKNLNLRGVDFTGIDFTGINILDLDLSECIITPQQIAQALGRVPTPLELKKILAPKKKKAKKRGNLDFSEFFLGNNREVGVFDATHSFTSVNKLLDAGKKVINAIAPKPEIHDSEIMSRFEHQRENEQAKHNESLRRAIEQNKRAVLEQRRLEKEREEQELTYETERKKQKSQKFAENAFVAKRGQNERS